MTTITEILPEEHTSDKGIEEIGPDSPLYKLDGTDNCIVITTEQYPDSIVIRGSGAGPERTAGGVLSDILKCI